MPLIVIGYDGSPDARRAVDVAGELFPGQAALVVTAWRVPVAAVDTPAPSWSAPAELSMAEEREVEHASRGTAEDGAARAGAAGLEAEPVLRRASGTAGIAQALSVIAEERDAQVVVVGRRGMSRLKAVVFGSVSDALLKEARRPVLIAPGHEDG